MQTQAKDPDEEVLNTLVPDICNHLPALATIKTVNKLKSISLISFFLFPKTKLLKMRENY